MAAVAVVATAHDARLDTAHLAQLQTASAVGEPSMSRSVHARTTSVASSSDLSSILSSEDEAPTRKRQRVKGSNTPPTSVDDDEDDEIVQQRLARKARAAALRIQREMEEIAQAEQDVPDRKLYLLAGLYASSNNARGVQSRRKTNKHTAKRGNAVNTDELAETFKFELPMHHGTTILNEERNFRLPWDIQNDFDLSTLPVTVDGLKFRSDALDRISRQKQPPPFKHIAQNRYVERLRDEAPLRAICMCKSGACDDSCINRMMQYFCSPRLCPLGNKCTNTPFNQRQVRHDLEVFWTGNRGFGLRTNTDIVAGEFVMEYRGEVISVNESYRRVQDEYKDRHDFYFLDYFGREVVDAGMQGNDARFINHSCSPNLQVVRWKLADYDEYQIGMFALRDIDAKEELCYDYGWQSFSSIGDVKSEDNASVVRSDTATPVPAKPQRCLCAAENCSGFLEKREGQKQTKAAGAIASRNKKKVAGK